MFRTRFLISIIALSTWGCAPQQSTEEIQADVLLGFNKLVDAVESVDAAAYYSFFDKNLFTAQFGGQTFHSFPQFKEMYDSYLPSLDKYLTLEFPVVEVRVVNSTTAVLVNEYTEVVLTALGDTLRASGSGTQVWQKKSDEWKLVHVAGSSRSAKVTEDLSQ